MDDADDEVHLLYLTIKEILSRAEQIFASKVELADDFAYVRSEVDAGPGVWETADLIRTLDWSRIPADITPAPLIRWILAAANVDGGFPPWPDISSRTSYIEPTARCTLSLLALGSKVPQAVPQLARALSKAVEWILRCQAEDGGWGSHSGWKTRTSPTCWALIVLSEIERTGASLANNACHGAIKRGVEWLLNIRNPDGGYGLSPGQKSNTCNTCQAALALSFNGIPVPNIHRRWILDASEQDAAYQDEPDAITDDPAAALFGRFELRLLAQPLMIFGLMSCKLALSDKRLLYALQRIVDSVDQDGLWHIPDGRRVWPSHFYMWALRTWIGTYEQYARSGLWHSSRSRLPIAENPLAQVVNSKDGRHVFLSHSSSDKVLVRQIARILEAAGLKVWLDERALVAGDDLVGELDDGLRRAHTVVFVISHMFKNERWLEYEVRTAVRLQIEGSPSLRIVPIVMEGSAEQIPSTVRNLVWREASDVVEVAALILRAISTSKE